MEDLAVSESFGAQLNQFHAANTSIAAVCHGPAARLAARKADESWTFDGVQ